MNEAGQLPTLNLSLARVYLRHSDPMVSVRTWQHVLDAIIQIKSGPTQARWLVREPIARMEREPSSAEVAKRT